MHQFHLRKRTFVGESADVLTKKGTFNDFHSQTERAGFGAVARALAFHWCGLGSIPCPAVIFGLSWLVRCTALRDFYPGTLRFSLLTEKTKSLSICCDLVWFVVSSICKVTRLGWYIDRFGQPNDVPNSNLSGNICSTLEEKLSSSRGHVISSISPLNSTIHSLNNKGQTVCILSSFNLCRVQT